MKLCLFPQWEDLISLMRNISRQFAADICERKIVALKPADGHALLTDHAVNTLTLTGGAVTLQMPDIIPGKARDFLVRVTADSESDLTFTGAEAFEGDNQKESRRIKGRTLRKSEKEAVNIRLIGCFLLILGGTPKGV